MTYAHVLRALTLTHDLHFVSQVFEKEARRMMKAGKKLTELQAEYIVRCCHPTLCCFDYLCHCVNISYRADRFDYLLSLCTRQLPCYSGRLKAGKICIW